MFKNLFVISLYCCTFLITSLSFANSEISLGGPGDSLEMNIVQDIQREVESYEPYESTCYREVSNGTRTECSTRSETRCTKKPLECHDEPIEFCSEVEDTTTESFSSTKYEKVVSYEYDYTVSALVSVLKKGMGQLNFSNNEFSFIAVNLAEASNFKLN